MRGILCGLMYVFGMAIMVYAGFIEDVLTSFLTATAGLFLSLGGLFLAIRKDNKKPLEAVM